MCQNKWMPLKCSRFRVLIYQVLLPGAPLFLAHVADGYDVTIHEVRLVFLRCMSFVFTALGHLVVLILCMEKKTKTWIILFLLLPVQAVPGGKTLTWCTAAQSKKYEKVAHGTQQPCWHGTRYPSSCNQSLRSRYFDLRDDFLMVLRPGLIIGLWP